MKKSDPVGTFINVLFALATALLFVLIALKRSPGFFGMVWLDDSWLSSGKALRATVAWWIVRMFLVIGVPGLLVFGILQLAPRARWVVGILLAIGYLALILLVSGVIHVGDERPRQHIDVQVQQMLSESEARQKVELEEHSRLLAERSDLTRQLTSQWRADVETAGATGIPGVVPPYVTAKESRQQVEVINRLPRSITLAVARVARAADGSLQRCLLDSGSAASIAPRGAHHFLMLRTGNPPGCFDGKLEFRIGTVESPEPSWWTKTALEDIETLMPPANPPPDTTNAALHDQNFRLKSQLGDTARPDRWRDDLAAARKR